MRGGAHCAKLAAKAYVVQISGESYRLKDKRKQKELERGQARGQSRDIGPGQICFGEMRKGGSEDFNRRWHSGIVSANQPQEEQSSTHQTTQYAPDASAQDNTSMDYGGVPETPGQLRSTRIRTCSPMPECELIIGGPI
jgi:hypothetical protein